MPLRCISRNWLPKSPVPKARRLTLTLEFLTAMTIESLDFLCMLVAAFTLGPADNMSEPIPISGSAYTSRGREPLSSNQNPRGGRPR